MHNFQQLCKEDSDSDSGREDFLRVSPPSLPPSSIYSALLIFNELSGSSHASDFLSSSSLPPVITCFLPSFLPTILHPIHFCCCIDDDGENDDGDIASGHN